MPIIQSAAKRVRQDKTRYRRNLSYKRNMRDAIKAVSSAVSNNDEKAAREQLPVAQKAIDKAVKKGVVHKNTAARKKSQIARKIDTAFASPTPKKQNAAKKPATTKKSPAKKSTSSTKKKK